MLRAYVHYFNRRYGFVGHLWQARFKSPAVEVEEYFLSCGRYIERNPLPARMVEQPWDYHWSSCRHYALGEVDPLLAANPWAGHSIDVFGSSNSTLRSHSLGEFSGLSIS